MTEATISPRLAHEGRQLDASLEACAEEIERALASGEFTGIPNPTLQRVLTAAVKLYAAKAEAEAIFPPPILADKITPTEVVLVVSEILRAADLNLFDLAMWYRRPR